MDGARNVYVADDSSYTIKELLAPDYTTVKTIGSGFNVPLGVAVDGPGNVYVADTYNNAVKELLAPGFTTINTLGAGFNIPVGIAVH